MYLDTIYAYTLSTIPKMKKKEVLSNHCHACLDTLPKIVTANSAHVVSPSCTSLPSWEESVVVASSIGTVGAAAAPSASSPPSYSC
jgi:hypothetical protein